VYFLRALILFREHDIALKALVNSAMTRSHQPPPARLQLEADSLFYLSHSALYVVLEAWQKLGFRDPKVDELLQSDLVPLLERFRHETFHYSGRFRWTPFNYTGPDTLDWVADVFRALCTFFIDRLGENARVNNFVRQVGAAQPGLGAAGRSRRTEK
jgi:hypothetical protein